MLVAIDVRDFFFAMALFFTGVNVMKGFLNRPLCKETYLLQMIGIVGLLISSLVVIVTGVK